MAKSETRSFAQPNETRSFDHGRIDLVNLGAETVGLYTFEPGWRWSNDVKPKVGTDSCQKDHIGYVVEGRLHVTMDDGSEMEAGPGDAYRIAPGHDAWVVGEETFKGLEFESESARTYATP
jgi:quercetin dioxygenase-like cupin family protein